MLTGDDIENSEDGMREVLVAMLDGGCSLDTLDGVSYLMPARGSNAKPRRVPVDVMAVMVAEGLISFRPHGGPRRPLSVAPRRGGRRRPPLRGPRA